MVWYGMDLNSGWMGIELYFEEHGYGHNGHMGSSDIVPPESTTWVVRISATICHLH